MGRHTKNSRWLSKLRVKSTTLHSWCQKVKDTIIAHEQAQNQRNRGGEVRGEGDERPPSDFGRNRSKSFFCSKGLDLWLMGIYGTSKLPTFYRTDFKHDLYCCIWWWFEMSTWNAFEHTVNPPPPTPPFEFQTFLWTCNSKYAPIIPQKSFISCYVLSRLCIEFSTNR